jgi:hypothetical protein
MILAVRRDRITARDGLVWYRIVSQWFFTANPFLGDIFLSGLEDRVIWNG